MASVYLRAAPIAIFKLTQVIFDIGLTGVLDTRAGRPVATIAGIDHPFQLDGQIGQVMGSLPIIADTAK